MSKCLFCDICQFGYDAKKHNILRIFCTKQLYLLHVRWGTLPWNYHNILASDCVSGQWFSRLLTLFSQGRWVCAKRIKSSLYFPFVGMAPQGSLFGVAHLTVVRFQQHVELLGKSSERMISQGPWDLILHSTFCLIEGSLSLSHWSSDTLRLFNLRARWCVSQGFRGGVWGLMLLTPPGLFGM